MIDEVNRWLGSGTAAASIALVALLVAPFLVAFAVSRLLLRRLMKGNGEISAGFSPSGASALLAVTVGQLFWYTVMVLYSAPSTSLGSAIVNCAVLFLPLFALSVPITIFYFFLVLRKKIVVGATLTCLICGFLLLTEILYLYKFFDGIE